MDVAGYLAGLTDAGERLGKAAAGCPLDAPVPTCPGWAVRDLLHHVGGVHRWATSYVLTGNPRATTDEEDARFFTRVADAQLVGWYREGHARLAAALSAAAPGMTCWTFLPASSPLAFWARRQAHETAIHCADAEAAAGLRSAFPAEFALDGIDELLNGFLARPKGTLVADPAVALGVRPTDAPEGWTIRIEPDRRTISPGVARAECVISGSASDLYLFLWNRAGTGAAVEVSGDARIADHWRRHANVRWG